ncbi:hypothetical protein IGI04_018952, partial [Brassica rapa subsp. trilocularis]
MLQLYLGNLSAIKPSHYGAFKDLRKEINYLDSLYLGNLSAIKPSHYGAFKDLRKEINYLDSAILLYFYILLFYDSKIRFLQKLPCNVVYKSMTLM